MIIKPSRKRLNSEFEPHYSPDLELFFKGHWQDVNRQKVCVLCLFVYDDAHEEIGVDKHQTLVFQDKLFEACDFRGATLENAKIVFKRCSFYQCDFAQSDLSNLKFSDCNFRDSSFTLCDFGNANFLRCRWQQIALSGIETKLNAAYITNPKQFLSAAYTSHPKVRYLDLSRSRKKFIATKATVARDLLSGLRNNGSESEFYQAVEVHEVAQGQSRIVSSLHSRKFLNALFHGLQLFLLVSFAQLNSWGKNPMRPLILFLLSSLVFTVIYYFFGVVETVPRAFEKSFNISMFSGYNYEIGKHYGKGGERLLQALQLFVSLICYTSFVATLVGRLSRIK